MSARMVGEVVGKSFFIIVSVIRKILKISPLLCRSADEHVECGNGRGFASSENCISVAFTGREVQRHAFYGWN